MIRRILNEVGLATWKPQIKNKIEKIGMDKGYAGGSKDCNFTKFMMLNWLYYKARANVVLINLPLFSYILIYLKIVRVTVNI